MQSHSLTFTIPSHSSLTSPRALHRRCLASVAGQPEMSLATGMERMIGKNTLRVLVIEDDYSTARILRMCLEASGFEVSVTSLGGQALHVLEKDPPHAVILDLGLPDGLGGDGLPRLRES